MSTHSTLTSTAGDGVQFLRGLTRLYGGEAAIEMWARMTEHLPDDLRGAMFVRMLDADVSDTLTLRITGNYNGVQVVRVMRELAHGIMPLKEAVEKLRIMEMGNSVELRIDTEKFGVLHAKNKLEMVGLTVN